MKIGDFIEKLELNCVNPGVNTDICVKGVYASDLLSDVMGFAKAGEVWVTLQTHKNVAAIAGLKDLSGVIIVGGHKPENDMIEKCTEEQIPVFTTKMSTYMVCGKIYEILNK